MDAFWSSFILFICSVVSQDLDGSGDNNSSSIIEYGGENKTFQVELFPSNPIYAGQTRTPRKLFQKIHSGAAFLAGLKVGTILSKKGFELGHGKIASSHSFHLFGTPVNSAMSLSYGNVAPLLPLVDDEVDKVSGQPKRSALTKGGGGGGVEEENVFHVTVIENPPSQTVEQLQAISSEVSVSPQDQVREDGERETSESDQVNENVVRPYQDTDLERRKVKEEEDFLKEHNQRVKEFNKSLLRTNSKILKE